MFLSLSFYTKKILPLLILSFITFNVQTVYATGNSDVLAQALAEAVEEANIAAEELNERERIIQTWEEAAAKGDVLAQYDLGNMYYEGSGVDQDYVKAREYFTLAAEQGNADAQHNLGVIYSMAQGTRQDLPQAAKYHTLAANQGNADSHYMLAAFYYEGDGVEKDITTAYAHLILTLELDSSYVRAKDAQNALKNDMTIAHYENAIALAAEMKAEIEKNKPVQEEVIAQ